MTFAAAEANCRSLDENSHLASIHDVDENNFLYTLATATFWIGGRKGWTWTDGTEWDYTQWIFGEPNNAKGLEECTRIAKSKTTKGSWNDANCALLSASICKRPSEFRDLYDKKL